MNRVLESRLITVPRTPRQMVPQNLAASPALLTCKMMSSPENGDSISALHLDLLQAIQCFNAEYRHYIVSQAC